MRLSLKRNETVVLEKKNEPREPPANRGRAELEQERRPRAVSANLSAGMLENNQMKRPRGALDLFLSIAGHALLFAAAIVLPLYFSEAIDLRGMETTYLVAPPLPPPPPAPAAVVHSIQRPKRFFSDNKLYAPHAIPKHIAKVKDLPSSPQPIAGVPGGVVGGVPGGQLSGVIGGILGDMGRIIPLPPRPKLVAHRGPYRVGSSIQQPQLIREVQPVYPILAKDEHIQGDVVID